MKNAAPTPEAPEPFLSETSVEAARVLIKIYSEVDIASAPVFRRVLDDAAGHQLPVVLDLTNCQYLDSTGISALIAGHHACRNISIIASPHAARILNIVGLTQQLNVTLAPDDPTLPASS